MEDLPELEFDPQRPQTPRGCDAENLIVILTPDDLSSTTAARGCMGIRTRAAATPPTTTRDNKGPLGLGPSASLSASGQPPSSSTDSRVNVNPFESKYLNNLDRTMWCPSVVDSVDATTPPLGNIAWNVNGKTQMFQKNIEETPNRNSLSSRLDLSVEMIDNFAVATSPSPLLNAPKKKFSFSTKQKREKKRISESWTNTEITLPKVLPKDVQEALKPFFQTTVSSETLLVGETPLPALCSGKPGEASRTPTASISNALFNSVRRRLDLSLGELSEPPSPSRGPNPPIPYGDPFENTHMTYSPGASPQAPQGDDDGDVETFNELVERFQRCEFTSKGCSVKTAAAAMKRKYVSPDVTPIRGFGNPSANRPGFVRGKDPRKMAKMFSDNSMES